MRSFAVLLSFAGLLPFATGVRAHGADWEVRMVGQRVAGYDVTVRTAPKQPRTGRLHVEVHEAELNLKKSGPWDVHLAIGGSHAQGNTSFRVDILP